MSSMMIIAAVTQALSSRLQGVIANSGTAVSHASVSADRPDRQDPSNPPKVNLYLYHVQPNASLRNMDLPTRNMDGAYYQNPQIPLDLYYLISFHGSESLDLLEAQQLMGICMGALHAEPTFTTEELVAALQNYTKDLPEDLYPQAVQVTPEVMGTNELSRLWQTFPNVPLALSTSYKASAVVITEEVPVEAAQVLERDFSFWPGALQRVWKGR